MAEQEARETGPTPRAVEVVYWARASERAAQERAASAERREMELRRRLQAALATQRAMRRDYDRVVAERDRLQERVLRLRALVWGTAPLRWLGRLWRAG